MGMFSSEIRLWNFFRWLTQKKEEDVGEGWDQLSLFADAQHSCWYTSLCKINVYFRLVTAIYVICSDEKK